MAKPTVRVALTLALSALLWCSDARRARAADETTWTQTEDVIYGRKYGVALTMDVFVPEQPNGAAVVWAVSGGWISAHEMAEATFPFSPVREFTGRGYTVFAVVHGSQPKFTIPEILEDMHRAVRYIRHHADDYGIDADRIGITGGSAGGHLSLMQGTAGTAGDPQATDPVERASSRVQAVGCFFPPTDFLNYGKPGENALGRGVLKEFAAPFAFHEPGATEIRYPAPVRITDEERILEIGRQISPITHVTSDDAPTLIIHGDADSLVPMQQAELIIARLNKADVPADLVVKQGAGHGWPNLAADFAMIADWFDKYLSE